MRDHRHNHSNAPDMHYIVPGLPFYKHFGNNAEMIPGFLGNIAGSWYGWLRRGLLRLRQIGAGGTVATNPPPARTNAAGAPRRLKGA